MHFYVPRPVGRAFCYGLYMFLTSSALMTMLGIVKEPLINVHKTSSACDLQIKNLKV